MSIYDCSKKRPSSLELARQRIAELEWENAALVEKLKVAEAALGKIEKWHGEFPDTGRYWDEPENTKPMSYSACFGSNGERDYMRSIAEAALAKIKEASNGTV